MTDGLDTVLTIYAVLIFLAGAAVATLLYWIF
jgi:hypothetical protein